MKILLIEDDAALSSALINCLTAHRYTVNLASDGPTGLALADACDYDLVLLDAAPPPPEAPELYAKLRRQGCAAPVLLLAAEDDGDRPSPRDPGIYDVLQRPFEMDELVGRIQTLVRELPAYPTTAGKPGEHPVTSTTNQVWHHYKGAFMAQMALFERATTALTLGDCSTALREEACHKAHKLIGSLTVFGLKEGARLAQRLEAVYCAEQPLDLDQLEELVGLTAQLRQTLQQGPQRSRV